MWKHQVLYYATHVKGEPWPSRSKQYFAVLPLAEVSTKVSPASLGCINAFNRCILVDVEGPGGKDVLDIISSLLDITLNIHSKTRGFRNGKTEVESYASGNAAETDEDAPHLVYVDRVVDTGIV